MVHKKKSNAPAESKLSRLRDQFDRMFDDRSGDTFGVRWMQKFYDNDNPVFELRDKKDEYILVAEIPGTGRDDIEIKHTNDMLRITGEKSESHEEEGDFFMFSEQQYVGFERAMKLPNGIEHEKISADVKNGLLTDHIPKSAAAKQRERKIPITAS